MDNKSYLTDKSKRLLRFRKEHDKPMAGVDLSRGAEVRAPAIYKTLNDLINYGLVERAKDIETTIVGKDGVEQKKTYKSFQLTEAGRKLVID